MKILVSVQFEDGESEVFSKKVQELTSGGIIIFNSNETARDGALREMLLESESDLFDFIKEMDCVSVTEPSTK